MPTVSKRKPLSRSTRFLLAWSVLLAISSVVRWQSPPPGPKDGQTVVVTPRFEGIERVPGTPVDLAFWDHRADSETATLVVLHGSPAASSFMMALHDELAGADSIRVITPDLPGFEGSAGSIPDYSIRAHAAYLGAMLDSLDIESAHLAGYSMGGGVAIEAMRQWPERIASVSLVAGIGVQEMELLGDYHLNHGIHGLQWAALWGVTNLVPHFGFLDHRMLGVAYARNFFDSDQRPLREVLIRWDKPMLIVHGDEDLFVPTAAALEHHRIVPHSELAMYEGVGHGLVITDEERIADDLLAFVSRAEQGEASFRDQATAARLEAASRPFDPADIPPASGFSLFVFAFLIALATLVSEDLASITAGLMAARGIIPFEWALGGAFFGIFIGDIGLYLMGRILGRRVVSVPPFSWFVSVGALERGARWFEKRGARVVIASRFVPGTRFPTYVAAGIIRAPFWKFVGYFALGTFLWTPVIVGVSMVLGQQILDLWTLYESYALLTLAAVIVTLYLIVHVGLPLFTYRGQRMWVSRWRRWTRWEFWPPWAFYPPVLWNVLRLMIRYRSMSLFTAANPGMDSGGFVGESKTQALSLIPDDADVVARWTCIRPLPDQDLEAIVRQEMANAGLELPLVLKPDVGERGHAVHIVRTEAELDQAIHHYPDAFLIQEYVAGEEFGLFYVRHPAEPNGTLFSITHKQLISVRGNGSDTLERLILDDERAVCMAPTFLKRHSARLDQIPADGERVPLVRVGTHARGALFTDGAELISPELEEAIDVFASRMPGFFFGRFDVRVPTAEHLRRGEGIRILEVNGVSSEATHVYDPSMPRKAAVATLAEQWRLAFEIGRANAELGARVTTVSELMRLIFQWKIRPSFRPDTRDAAEWSLRDATN